MAKIDPVCPCALVSSCSLWHLKYVVILLSFYPAVVCLLDSISVLITRFDLSYNADDYDRSINEAIKITKYVDHLYCLINFLW